MKLNTWTSGVWLVCTHICRWCRDAHPVFCRALHQAMMPKSSWLWLVAKGVTEVRLGLKRLVVSGLQYAVLKTFVTLFIPIWVALRNGWCCQMHGDSPAQRFGRTCLVISSNNSFWQGGGSWQACSEADELVYSACPQQRRGQEGVPMGNCTAQSCWWAWAGGSLLSKIPLLKTMAKQGMWQGITVYHPFGKADRTVCLQSRLSQLLRKQLHRFKIF